MKLVDLDVVLVLPEGLRTRALQCSHVLSVQISAVGSASHFRLGKTFPGECGGPCEPHVSLFMLTVEEAELDDATRVVKQLATTLPSLAVEGAEYRHNPHGAPELYFTKSAEWRSFQRAIIDVVEPLRRGRLREVDPAGNRILDVVNSPAQENPQRQQLLRYGYDEVADESNGGHDLFNPHVTLAWPRDSNFRVPLDDLPPPSKFSGLLGKLALFGMSGYGTCTKNYGIFSLKRR